MIIRLITMIIVFFVSANLIADPGCRDSQLISGKLITDMCWDCVFPIRVAGS